MRYLRGPGRPLSRASRVPIGPGGPIDVAPVASVAPIFIWSTRLPDPKLPVIRATIVASRALGPASPRRDRTRAAAVSGPRGRCDYCTSGREGLCAEARFTGYRSTGLRGPRSPTRYVLPLPGL
jgi:propanol-preferring alcohol dehydrogenase